MLLPQEYCQYYVGLHQPTLMWIYCHKRLQGKHLGIVQHKDYLLGQVGTISQGFLEQLEIESNDFVVFFWYKSNYIICWEMLFTLVLLIFIVFYFFINWFSDQSQVHIWFGAIFIDKISVILIHIYDIKSHQNIIHVDISILIKPVIHGKWV